MPPPGLPLRAPLSALLVIAFVLPSVRENRMTLLPIIAVSAAVLLVAYFTYGRLLTRLRHATQRVDPLLAPACGFERLTSRHGQCFAETPHEGGGPAVARLRGDLPEAALSLLRATLAQQRTLPQLQHKIAGGNHRLPAARFRTHLMGVAAVGHKPRAAAAHHADAEEREELQRHQREFVSAFYGKAAPKITAYLDLVEQQVKDTSVHAHIFDRPSAKYLNAEFAAAGDTILAEAEAMAESDAVRKRVQLARLPVWYVQIVNDYVKDQARADLIKKFLEIARASGMTQVSEGTTLKDWAAKMGQP